MFNESYYIFSVGNIKPIWTEEYPTCWKVCLHIQPLRHLNYIELRIRVITLLTCLDMRCTVALLDFALRACCTARCWPQQGGSTEGSSCKS